MNTNTQMVGLLNKYSEGGKGSGHLAHQGRRGGGSSKIRPEYRKALIRARLDRGELGPEIEATLKRYLGEPVEEGLGDITDNLSKFLGNSAKGAKKFIFNKFKSATGKKKNKRGK